MTFRHGILGGRKRYSGGDAPETYSINILYPTEGEEVSADFTMTATDNQTTISINLTEGQEVTEDFTVTFE